MRRSRFPLPARSRVQGVDPPEFRRDGDLALLPRIRTRAPALLGAVVLIARPRTRPGRRADLTGNEGSEGLPATAAAAPAVVAGIPAEAVILTGIGVKTPARAAAILRIGGAGSTSPVRAEPALL